MNLHAQTGKEKKTQNQLLKTTFSASEDLNMDIAGVNSKSIPSKNVKLDLLLLSCRKYVETVRQVGDFS